MNADPQFEVSSVGPQGDFKLPSSFLHLCKDIAGETSHDHSMLSVWLRQSSDSNIYRTEM